MALESACDEVRFEILGFQKVTFVTAALSFSAIYFFLTSPSYPSPPFFWLRKARLSQSLARPQLLLGRGGALTLWERGVLELFSVSRCGTSPNAAAAHIPCMVRAGKCMDAEDDGQGWLEAVFENGQYCPP